MKLCFKRWIKTPNVNVSNETTIEKCVILLLKLHKNSETFLGTKRMVGILKKQ